MIALDTNILARFYVDDPNDSEAIQQRPLARQILAESTSIYIPLTVVLELEWVLRAFYQFSSADFIRVIEHLLGLQNVNVEEWSRVVDALKLHRNGFDFADALHLCSSGHCDEFVTFDDRRFARRSKALNTITKVRVPKIAQ